jgi:hypothetical protein
LVNKHIINKNAGTEEKVVVHGSLSIPGGELNGQTAEFTAHNLVVLG